MIFEHIQDRFIALIQHGIWARLIVSVVIFAGAVILIRLLNRIWSRWHDRLLAGEKKERHVDVASVDTKVAIAQKIVNSLVYFMAFTFFLMQFEPIRNIGTGLLASAGILGIVIGLAAQNTVANLIAGLSISFSQPVRLNDAIIFEGEFGWIEDIMLMHTTIRTWDNRRIMVPNNVLLNKVVQNWTIKDPSLLGTIMVYVDYTSDVDLVRGWIEEIVLASEHSHSEKAFAVQVVDFTEKTMVLRILAKGPDAPSTWNLRCEIREKLIRKHQEAGMVLPKVRVEAPPVKPPEGQ